MMTPPFNMRARPVLTVKVDSALPFVTVVPLEGSSVAMVVVASDEIFFWRVEGQDDKNQV
jgi:hypothetical protein